MFKANPHPLVKPQELFTQGSNAQLTNALQADSLIKYLSSAYYRPSGYGRLLVFQANQNLGDDFKIRTGCDVQDMAQSKTWETTLELVFGAINLGTGRLRGFFVRHRYSGKKEVEPVQAMPLPLRCRPSAASP